MKNVIKKNFEDIIESLYEGIIVLDHNGKCKDCNPSAFSIFGYSCKERLCQEFSTIQFIREDGSLIPKTDCLIQKSLRNREVLKESTIGFKKGNEIVWISLSSMPLHQADQDNLLGSVLSFRDITERKNLETKIKELNENLEKQIQLRTLDLEREICQRKVYEFELIDQKNILSTIFQTLIDGLITIDTHGIIVNINYAAEVLFGYSKVELIGRPVNMLMPLYYASRHDQYLKNYLTTGERKIIGIGREVVGRKKDGTEFPLELHIGEVKVKGTILFTGLVRDITNKKKVEAELIYLNDRFSKIFYTSPIGILISSIETEEILEVNQEFCKICKYERDEVLNKTSSSLGFWTDEKFRLTMKKILLSEQPFYNYETCLVAKDGTIKSLLVSIDVIDFLGKKCLIKIINDITKITKTQELLRISEERYRLLASSLPDTDVYLLDGSGNFMVACGSEMKKRGYSSLDFEGCYITDLKNFDFYQPIATQFNNIFLGRHELEEIENKGEWFSIQAFPLFDTSKIVYSCIIVLQNISKQKKIHIELQHSIEEQKKLVEIKSRFVTTVSHEFRTPLTGILTSVQILKKLGHKLDEEKKNIKLQEIEKAVRLLVNMLETSTMITKIDSNLYQKNRDSIDIIDYSKKIWLEVKNSSSRSVELEMNITVDDRVIFIDEFVYRTILINLLSNAIKYSDQSNTIFLEIHKARKNLYLKVKDNGIGIPQEDQKYLFQPFFRAGNVSKISGTGLGLSIVKRLVELYEGTIEVQSFENKGTLFIVSLKLE